MVNHIAWHKGAGTGSGSGNHLIWVPAGTGSGSANHISWGCQPPFSAACDNTRSAVITAATTAHVKVDNVVSVNDICAFSAPPNHFCSVFNGVTLSMGIGFGPLGSKLLPDCCDESKLPCNGVLAFVPPTGNGTCTLTIVICLAPDTVGSSYHWHVSAQYTTPSVGGVSSIVDFASNSLPLTAGGHYETRGTFTMTKISTSESGVGSPFCDHSATTMDLTIL